MNLSTPSFELLENTGGLLYKSEGNGGHADFYGHKQRTEFQQDKTSTFGYVIKGPIHLTYGSHTLKLSEGMYFSINTGKYRMTMAGGEAIYVVAIGQDCLNNIGGPIEEEGRLKYIDGCTDSLLIPPMIKGLGCLNLLHFPENISQTMHTHPSVRIGVVARGKGECVTPFGNLPLDKGNIFIIKENSDGGKSIGDDGKEHWDGSHKFNTLDSIMDVIAFHPDSDFGPEHEDHPMINRTIVDGVSANQIKAIQT